MTFSASVKWGHIREVPCVPGARLILAGVPTSAGPPESQARVPTSPGTSGSEPQGRLLGHASKGGAWTWGRGLGRTGWGGATGTGPRVPPRALRAAGAEPAGGAAAFPKARGRRGRAGCAGQVLRAHRHDVHGCVCIRLCAHISRLPAPPSHTCTHGRRPAPRTATLVACATESRPQAVGRPLSPPCLPPGRPPPPAARGPGVFPHPAFGRSRLRFSRGSQSLGSKLADGEPKGSPPTWNGPLYLAHRRAGRS